MSEWERGLRSHRIIVNVFLKRKRGTLLLGNLTTKCFEFLGGMFYINARSAICFLGSHLRGGYFEVRI